MFELKTERVNISEILIMYVFLRFADIFGARAALSLSCLASVIYFLLLAAADSAFLLFLHKLPAVFMHAFPGQTYYYKYIQLIIHKLPAAFDHS